MPRTTLPIRPRAKKPDLTVGQILTWADDFHRTHGRWPNMTDGRVEGTADQTWLAADASLRVGTRGLPGGSSFAKLLLRCRGRRHWHLPPDLSLTRILAWADAHYRRTGDWPGGHDTGQIPNAPKGLTWVAVEIALHRGKRNLPGGTTLAQLLEKHRGVRNRLAVPDLSEAVILSWADKHHNRTGEWPKYQDGEITAAPGETWHAVDTALTRGIRGMSGGDSMAKLLARSRDVRNKSDLPSLTVAEIRTWAEAHKNRTGTWPRVKAGSIPEAPGETWSGVNAALMVGMRGLPGGDSLAKLLAREFGKRNLADVPPLTLARIRKWLRQHHATTGQWAKYTSGPIAGVPGETWGAVDNALHKGRRGLPGGSSVARVVRECRAGRRTVEKGGG
jgi:hypothetical protein